MADVARPTRRQIVSELGDVLHDLPAILTTPLYRRWHLRWGATPAEAAAALPGDALLPRAQYKSTRAITIGAPPDVVWPWLVQVGCQRAGFYSNDLLDNLGHPSATTIVPSLQKLEVGQWVPMSPAATPTERTAFKVHSFELAEWLLWSKPDSTWAWRLTATGDGGTRLVTRIHAVYDWRNPLMGLLGVLLMEFGDFAMLRRMLRGIKARAESLVQDTAGRKNKMSRTEPGVALTPAQRILAPNAASGEGASGGFYTPTTQRPQTRNNLQLLVGLAAIAFSAVYFISDLIEVAQGGFSTFRLILTYIGEAAIPLFVIGLYAVQRPRIGRLGFGGAITYAYAYVFFTSTVIYALISGTRDYEALTKVFGAWMTVHGLILLLGGLAFGLAVVRAGVLPRWTGVCLMVGVVLVVAASGLPDIARTVAASVPAIAFIGMGAALLRDGNRCLGRATSVPQLPGIHDHAADMKRAATSTH